MIRGMECSALIPRRGRIALAFAGACLASLAPAGCRPVPTAPPNSTAAAPTSTVTPARPYTPVFARREAVAAQGKRGTLRDDFQRAADASTLEEAATRWEEFLRTHSPSGESGAANEEYEDAFEANHVNSARYELMRIYYLLGRQEDGDRILRELDPLSLSN